MRGRGWAREEQETERVALAWYTAALTRTKKLPDLATVLHSSDGSTEQSAADMMAVVRMLQASGADMVIEEVD